MKNKHTFNAYRFSGFHYKSYSPKYWIFSSQVNDDESKVLVRVAATNLFSYTTDTGKTKYVLKLDRTHCAFLNSWQYFKGHYGNYVLLDKDYYHAVTARKEFKEMALNGSMLTFAKALSIAKKQEKDQPALSLLIKKQ